MGLPRVRHDLVNEQVTLNYKWSRSVVSNSLQPVDCSPPGSSIHGILQARILEWVAISFSRGSSWPRDRTQVSCIAGRRFNLWATREALLTTREVRKCRPHDLLELLLLWVGENRYWGTQLSLPHYLVILNALCHWCLMFKMKKIIEPPIIKLLWMWNSNNQHRRVTILSGT